MNVFICILDRIEARFAPTTNLKNRCAAGRTVKVKTCCEALTFDKVGREKGLK